MADFSEFPFDMYTTNQITQMMIGSVRVGDDEFAKACREEIKRRKMHEESEHENS